jgi:heptosyltransferase-2
MVEPSSRGSAYGGKHRSEVNGPGKEPTTVRILIVQTAFLGDVVLTLPLVEALHQHFPEASVEMLTVPAPAPLLHDQPRVAAVLTYDKRGTQRGLRGFLSIVRHIRARGYDLVLSPHRSVRSALLVACSGIPQRVGFTQWFTRWAYTSTVPRPLATHEVQRNLHLLSALDTSPLPDIDRLSLCVAALARQSAAAYFARCGVEPDDQVIGIIPGSQWGTKRWPAERFAVLIERLAETPRTRFVLIGGPQDRAIAETIRATCHTPVLDLIGQTPLHELPAYIEHCTVVVSNDTGPMHIAAALGKPIVALFGPTTSAMGFAPYGVPWEEVSVALDCRPCNAHGPQQCPLSHWRCMLELSVEQVAASVRRLLSHAAYAQEKRL